jgi:hypothetical protein
VLQFHICQEEHVVDCHLRLPIADDSRDEQHPASNSW